MPFITQVLLPKRDNQGGALAGNDSPPSMPE
jgi:hypothetical protein